ncbi:hypothetical protein [uncultured Kordia sp.]|uniref:hypothetical protein n=1 Tax=uncultured Kordia sp. TaxID=507699 RepID=UPI002632EFBD|nr:hypothetical protein [uncultured Kordia sp.]
MPISDKRKHQLASCKICQLRDFEPEVGITCALTKKVADFENECSSIQIDFEVLDDKQVEVHNTIMNYIKTNFRLYGLRKKDYLQPNHPIQKKYNHKKNTHNLTFKEILQPSVLFGIGMLALFVFSTLALQTESGLKFLFGFLAFVAVCFTIARGVIDYYTPAKNRITTDELGFTYKEKRFFWHDIVDYRILERRGKRGFFNLIIGTIYGDVHSFDLLYVKITPDELIEILNLNRKDYFTRFERNLPEIF